MTSPTTSSLAGQIAVVTGAGRGIGAAIARKLAGMGAVAVLCGRKRSSLDSTAAAISAAGGKSHVVECDVMDLTSVERLAGEVERSFRRTDVLVNNAGIGGFGGPLHELPSDSLDKVLNTNLRGVYYCIRSFAPMMIGARSGHIVNISSLAGKERGGVRGVQMGFEWIDLLSGGRVASAQHTSIGYLSGIRAH